MLSILSNRIMANRLGPAKPRGRTWNGVGAWVIFSNSRQVNFSRTDCTTIPLPRDRFQGLGHVLAQLGESGRAAAGAGGRPWNDHPFARQVRRKRLARRLLAREGTDNGALRGGLLGLVLSRAGFELLELKLHLVEQPRLTLAARPVSLAHLLDDEPQMHDQCRHARCFRARSRKFGIAGANQLLKSLDIVRKRITSAHRQ
jgi:hypothetical protein